MLDGNPRLNLASFVTAWMEPECNNLIMPSINKKHVDMDEYPITIELQGYEKIIENCIENATVLREGLEITGHFDIASKDVGVPLVAVSLKDCRKYTIFGISESLRRFGWIIPAYSMPPDAEHIAVLQVVNREHFSRSLVEKLISHIEHVMKEMDLLPDIVPAKAAKLMATNGGKTQEEITRYWRRLVDSKRAGVCWMPPPPCLHCFACYLLFVL
uniref:Uncharacterized protein MANES_06G000800 n=2 Tax=Rhizophora mucronata TaxID=61149 RepID=A0A2P2IZR3_RHIMU